MLIFKSKSTLSIKAQRLMSELAIVNMNLPARVWLPIYEFPHYVVRIPYRSAAVLNSKEKAPYIVYIEVIECDNIFSTPLTPKLLDNYLQSVKSHENLASMLGSGNIPNNNASSNGNGVNTSGGNTNNTNNNSGSGGVVGEETNETNSSQVNFNLLSSADSSAAVQQPQQQPPLESTSPPKSKPSIVEPATMGVPKVTSGEGSGLFDPNNFDRWSISSDVGPMNVNSNGNGYFRVSI